MKQKFYYIYKDRFHKDSSVQITSITFNDRESFLSLMRHNKELAMEVPYSCVRKVIEKSILDRAWFNENWPFGWPE